MSNVPERDEKGQDPMLALRDLIELGTHGTFRLSPRPTGYHAETGSSSYSGPSLTYCLGWLVGKIDREVTVASEIVRHESDNRRGCKCPFCGEVNSIEKKTLPVAYGATALRTYHRVTTCKDFAGFASEGGKTLAIFAAYMQRRCDLCESWNGDAEDECRECGGDTRGIVRYEPDGEPSDER